MMLMTSGRLTIELKDTLFPSKVVADSEEFVGLYGVTRISCHADLHINLSFALSIAKKADLP
jgi:hypothetical protein